MLFAIIGIFIMIKDGLETSGAYSGNLMALATAICFSGFIIITPHIADLTSESNTRVSFLTAQTVAEFIAK